MPLTSHLPITTMTNKRKFNDSQHTPCKRARLITLSTPDHSGTKSEQVALTLRQKRKRVDEPEADLFREPKARRTGAAHDASARVRQPRGLSPGSKWMTFSDPSDPDDSKEPACGRYWERMTARTRPLLVRPSVPGPAPSPASVMKGKKINKTGKKTTTVPVGTSGTPRPAGPRGKLPTLADDSYRKRQMRQQVKDGDQRRPRTRKPSTHSQDSVSKRRSRPFSISQFALDLISNDDFAWPEEVIR
ncbi:hypothetical protein ACQKWADRAFT_308038 [Trichoderma austrokoningii]